MNLKMDQQLAEELRKAAAIYTKPGLSDYQQCVNDAGLKLCQKNPTMIRNRAELLRLAQEVHESGYMYKGKSRSKRFGISETTPKWPKSDSEFRVQRMKELEQDLEGLNKRITIKETRCEAGAASKNFKLCDQLADEIASLKQQRREKEAERQELERKVEMVLEEKCLLQADDSMSWSLLMIVNKLVLALPRNDPEVAPPKPHLSVHPSLLSPSPYSCSETGDSRATVVKLLSIFERSKNESLSEYITVNSSTCVSKFSSLSLKEYCLARKQYCLLRHVDTRCDCQNNYDDCSREDSP